VTVDPSRPEHVGPALLEYLASHLGLAGATFADPAHQIGRGFDTYTYAFRLKGDALDAMWLRPLVIRIFPGAGQSPRVRREAAIQSFVVEHGYSAPRILAVEPTANVLEHPFVVMERVRGVPVSRHISSGNLIGIYRLARRTADAHVALHRLPVEGWPVPSEGDSVDRQLARAREWIGRVEGLEQPLTWLEAHKGSVLREEPSICHNDFQPLNLIADEDGRVAVIDWSNAELGDRHQDVADALVTMQTAPLPGSQTLLRRLLRRLGRSVFTRAYLSRYRGQLPVDRDRLRYWEAQRAFGRWGVLSVLESFGPESLAMKPVVAPGATAAGQRALLRRYFTDRMRA
jgi:aminoglycoside phosphotransferase (APT) family kinase protein